MGRKMYVIMNKKTGEERCIPEFLFNKAPLPEGWTLKEEIDVS